MQIKSRYYADKVGTKLYYLIESHELSDSHGSSKQKILHLPLTPVEYFLEGMAVAFENVLKRMDEAKTQGSSDQSALIRKLDPKQRKVLELFQEFETITSRQIGELFGFKPLLYDVEGFCYSPAEYVSILIREFLVYVYLWIMLIGRSGIKACKDYYSRLVRGAGFFERGG